MTVRQKAYIEKTTNYSIYNYNMLKKQICPVNKKGVIKYEAKN